MRKTLLVALAVLFAGCADSSGGGGSDGGGTSSSSMTSTGPPPKPVVLSDTLHLLAPPEMAPALPEGSMETSTPANTGFNGPGGGGGGQDEPGAEWSYQVAAAGNVSGADVHIWIEITETLFHAATPARPECTWVVSLQMGADSDEVVSCLIEPPGPINAGTRELVFNLVGLDAEMEVNETITLGFRRNAFSASAENAVFVLSGSIEHDSRAVFKGLKEPVPE